MLLELRLRHAQFDALLLVLAAARARRRAHAIVRRRLHEEREERLQAARIDQRERELPCERRPLRPRAATERVAQRFQRAGTRQATLSAANKACRDFWN